VILLEPWPVQIFTRQPIFVIFSNNSLVSSVLFFNFWNYSVPQPFQRRQFCLWTGKGFMSPLPPKKSSVSRQIESALFGRTMTLQVLFWQNPSLYEARGVMRIIMDPVATITMATMKSCTLSRQGQALSVSWTHLVEMRTGPPIVLW